MSLDWTPARSNAAGAGRRAAPLAALVATGLVVAGAWWFAMGQAHAPLPSVATTVSRAVGFLQRLLGAGAATPAYADAGSWAAVGHLAMETVVMSVLAMGIATGGVVLTFPLASRWVAVGDLHGPGRWLAAALHLLIRGAHVVSRAVPELVWALLVVFAIRPGVLAGAIALALHEFGVLGRLTSDVVDNLGRDPLRALRSAGARRWQLYAYGVLPRVYPQLATFLLYRWEVVMRATVIVGFITGAGLGYQLRLDLSFRRWTDLALILLAYVVLVWSAEVIAALLRRLAR